MSDADKIADAEPTPGGLNQRHPDFAALAVRIGRAIGREAESIHALKSAEQDKSFFCLENDTIATAFVISCFLMTWPDRNGLGLARTILDVSAYVPATRPVAC